MVGQEQLGVAQRLQREAPGELLVERRAVLDLDALQAQVQQGRAGHVGAVGHHHPLQGVGARQVHHVGGVTQPGRGARRARGVGPVEQAHELETRHAPTAQLFVDHVHRRAAPHHREAFGEARARHPAGPAHAQAVGREVAGAGAGQHQEGVDLQPDQHAFQVEGLVDADHHVVHQRQRHQHDDHGLDQPHDHQRRLQDHRPAVQVAQGHGHLQHQHQQQRAHQDEQRLVRRQGDQPLGRHEAIHDGTQVRHGHHHREQQQGLDQEERQDGGAACQLISGAPSAPRSRPGHWGSRWRVFRRRRAS